MTQSTTPTRADDVAAHAAKQSAQVAYVQQQSAPALEAAVRRLADAREAVERATAEVRTVQETATAALHGLAIQQRDIEARLRASAPRAIAAFIDEVHRSDGLREQIARRVVVKPRTTDRLDRETGRPAVEAWSNKAAVETALGALMAACQAAERLTFEALDEEDANQRLDALRASLRPQLDQTDTFARIA